MNTQNENPTKGQWKRNEKKMKRRKKESLQRIMNKGDLRKAKQNTTQKQKRKQSDQRRKKTFFFLLLFLPFVFFLFISNIFERNKAFE